MRKYLASLPNKPDTHKRHFSYVVSALFTLFIFLIWSLVNFGMSDTDTVVQKNTGNLAAGAAYSNEPSPLEGLVGGFAESLVSIKESFKDIFDTNVDNAKSGIENVNINQGYEDLRNQALQNNYGE